MRVFVAAVFLSFAVRTFAADASWSSCESCRVALAPHEGAGAIDRQIIEAQRAAAGATDPRGALEKLGWLLVSKARASYDPGFYKLAEQCAACMESIEPGNLDAALLRGHVLQSLHRFAEAEATARDLVQRRGLPFDFGLLGDALVDQGRVGEAADAYQKMMDLKPDLQAYVRAAHIRWLLGDLDGALEAAEMAARAGSPRDPESAAWAYSRYAFYLFQAGRIDTALHACDIALKFQVDCAPALLLRGKILLAQAKSGEAVASLNRAAALNPLPEYQWALADALRASGASGQAADVEATLTRRGAAEDPRTFALFLATRGQDAGRALELASRELATRSDIFSLDALAWALRASGRASEAAGPMQRALAEGTQDARLFLHAGVIARETDKADEARALFARAAAAQQSLLPSERALLEQQMAGPDRSGPEVTQ